MSKHKNIKSILRKLTTLTVVPMLKNSSTKSEIYKEILAKAKELNILATASVMQSMHTKLATSIQIESIQRDLIALGEEL